MNHAVAVNVLIVLLVAFTVWLTKDALALFCLMFLKELPYDLAKNPNVIYDEDEPANAEGSLSGSCNNIVYLSNNAL
jgi:hypothetical protein